MKKHRSSSVALMNFAKRLRSENTGSVLLIVAIALPILLGFGALALGYGSALLAKAKDQRTTDLAAYAGAFEFNQQSGNLNDKKDAAKVAAAFVATQNGVASGIKITFVPKDDPDSIKVERTGSKSIVLSNLTRPNSDVTITTMSVVNLGDGGGGLIPCILASGNATATEKDDISKFNGISPKKSRRKL